MNKTIIIGGIAVVAGYFIFFKGAKKTTTALIPTESKYKFVYELRKDPSGGNMCFKTGTNTLVPLLKCSNSLSGYFGLDGYFSTGNVPKGPCCRNCAHGLPCAS